MRDPARTIPSAIPLALGITLVIYAAVALAALLAVGPERLAGADAPLAEAVRAGSLDWLAGAVRVGAVVITVVLAADIRGAIAFSSFSVLVYYAIANASAWTLRPQERRWPRWLAGLGLAGGLLWQPPCPSPVVAVGAAMLAIGATGRMVLTAPATGCRNETKSFTLPRWRISGSARWAGQR